MCGGFIAAMAAFANEIELQTFLLALSPATPLQVPQAFGVPTVTVSPTNFLTISISGSAAAGGVLPVTGEVVTLSLDMRCNRVGHSVVTVVVPVLGARMFANVQFAFVKTCAGTCFVCCDVMCCE